MNDEQIDRIDLTILMALEAADHPLWKKSVHRALQELPRIPAELATVSVQTVGRRIDRLHEQGLLHPNIVTPENINRDLIIAYEVTDRGREAIARKRESILREHVATAAPVNAPTEEETSYMAELFADEVGLEEDSRDIVHSYSEHELAALIAAYYLRTDITSALEQEAAERLAQLAGDGDHLAAVAAWIRDLHENGG